MAGDAQIGVGARQGARSLAVAVGGFGAIGRRVAQALDDGIPGLRLSAVSAFNRPRAEDAVRCFSRPVPVLPLAELADAADIVVECAPADRLTEIAVPALTAGRLLVVVSVGALLSAGELIDLARTHGGQIVVPTGALIGLDAVSAAAEGRISSVHMITRKPPRGLVGAPHLVASGIDLEALDGPVQVFRGTAREAAKGFPANLNVAAALGLAGIGPDRTTIEIWADPGLRHNTHQIEVVSDSARFSMKIENIPSDENPKTGRITALSVIAALRKMTSPLRMGT